MLQEPRFLSATQFLLTTLVVKLAAMAALATMLARYRRFRHILIFEQRNWPDRLVFALGLGLPLTAGVAARVLLNYDAADLMLEGAFLAGLIAGPYTGALVGLAIALPALAAGHLVLGDRFTSSTLAYQGSAGGLPLEGILAVGKVATENHQPDLTVIFDVDETVAARRLSANLDRIEQRPAEFHRKVRGGFLQQAKDCPGRYAVLDASREPDAVFAELLATVTLRLGR